jgi:tetratricopeptide (TPR) repeat protein
LVVLAALLASARRVRRLRLHAREASPQLARLAAGTPLLVSEKAVVPMTWGLRRPFILLPAGAESWSDERLRAVLLHERAHIVRRDLISLAFINAVAAMAWFHPLVWLARARALELCEEACDDAVVRGGVLGSRYAEELVAIARTTEGRRIVATTAILPARSALPRRIAALVSASRSRREVGRRSVALAITASFLLFGPLAAMRVDARPSTRIATPQALVELERSLAAGFDDVRALRSDPKYAPWQNDPRFRSLLALASELELMQPAWRNDRPDGDEQARWTPAVAAFKRMTESRPDLGRTWFNLGYALHARGDEPQAIDAFRQALDRGYRPGTTSYNIACAFARLGRNDDALRWLAHARDSGFDLRPSLATDRDLDALRTDPRLAALDR